MPLRNLSDLPNGSDIFIDANVLVYGLMNKSASCFQLLERCSREEVSGATSFEVIAEATHAFMLAEARSKGLQGTAKYLSAHPEQVKVLTGYWQYASRILNLNLLLLPSDESILRSAQAERTRFGLLTNDSLAVASARAYGLDAIATGDAGFQAVADMTIFAPTDILPN